MCFFSGDGDFPSSVASDTGSENLLELVGEQLGSETWSGDYTDSGDGTETDNEDNSIGIDVSQSRYVGELSASDSMVVSALVACNEDFTQQVSDSEIVRQKAYLLTLKLLYK